LVTMSGAGLSAFIVAEARELTGEDEAQFAGGKELVGVGWDGGVGTARELGLVCRGGLRD
jgi:hypothetical protein